MAQALRGFVIALASGVALACQDPAPDVLSIDDSGLPIETSVIADPDVITTGDTTRLSVTVRNHGPRSMTLTFPSGCQLGFQVLDSSGTFVSPLGVACTTAVTYLTLAAAEAKTATFNWIGSRDWMDPDSPLPPGEYQVRGGLGIGAQLRYPSAPVPVIIR